MFLLFVWCEKGRIQIFKGEKQVIYTKTLTKMSNWRDSEILEVLSVRTNAEISRQIKDWQRLMTKL